VRKRECDETCERDEVRKRRSYITRGLMRFEVLKAAKMLLIETLCELKSRRGLHRYQDRSRVPTSSHDFTGQKGSIDRLY
jgi:hypothetical protein